MISILTQTIEIRMHKVRSMIVPSTKLYVFAVCHPPSTISSHETHLQVSTVSVAFLCMHDWSFWNGQPPKLKYGLRGPP